MLLFGSPFGFQFTDAAGDFPEVSEGFGIFDPGFAVVWDAIFGLGTEFGDAGFGAEHGGVLFFDAMKRGGVGALDHGEKVVGAGEFSSGIRGRQRRGGSGAQRGRWRERGFLGDTPGTGVVLWGLRGRVGQVGCLGVRGR